MVLTVQTTEVAPRTGDGKTCRTGVEVIKRLLFHGVDGQSAGPGIDLADQNAVSVAAAAADAALTICEAAMVRTELAYDGSVF